MKKNDKIFIILLFMVGLIFSLFFPIYQIPDEKTHLQMIYDEMNQSIDVNKVYGDFADTDRIIRNYDEKVDIKNYFNFDCKLERNLKITLPNVFIVRHLPQSLAIVLGHLLQLPAFIVLFLAEFFAICFYTISCVIVLKILPIKKTMMKFIMLLPIVIQQMGSLSYDVVLISLSFIFLAYILYLKFDKDTIKCTDILILILLLACITITKIPYMLLALLLLILPFDKICFIALIKSINNKWKRLLLLLFIIIMCLIGLLIARTSHGKVLIIFFIHPVELFKTLFVTLKSHGTGFLYTLFGNFGWLDTPVSLIYCFFAALIGFSFNFMITDEEKNKKFDTRDKIILSFVFILNFIVIILSLYEWTISMNGIKHFNTWTYSYTIDFIKKNTIVVDGIQGRYFVPIIPIIFFAISSNKISKFLNKINLNIIKIIGLTSIIIYMFIIILFRYWI